MTGGRKLSTEACMLRPRRKSSHKRHNPWLVHFSTRIRRASNWSSSEFGSGISGCSSCGSKNHWRTLHFCVHAAGLETTSLIDIGRHGTSSRIEKTIKWIYRDLYNSQYWTATDNNCCCRDLHVPRQRAHLHFCLQCAEVHLEKSCTSWNMTHVAGIEK